MNNETKNLILSSASKLFAVDGFDKVSIREIATDAKVNVSAVSYYFGGKDGLFKEVLLNCSQQFEKATEKVCTESKDLPSFAMTFFDYCVSEESHLKNIIRILLVPKGTSSQEFTKIFKEIPNIPPGIQHILNLLEEKHNISGDSQEGFWIARTLYFSIKHHCLSSFFIGFDELAKIDSKKHSLEEYRRSLGLLAQSLLKFNSNS